ncbi:transglycosylase domain-containing protein [Halonatronum saccharophilum]|uniref:transglycosylase domain-containing protein n=1 Tax=Halonatronum saccharophilum TaxID=150060 RepID=UPI000481816A|nr:PBP1A family penicillin-binding protein [Halonatronum saccharophilum]
MANKKQQKTQLIIVSIILVFAISMGVIIGGVAWIIKQSPDISDYGQWKTNESTIIYASNGEILTRLYQQDRIYVPIDNIPDHLKNAVIAMEDERFFQHHGVDIRGIMRAITVNIQNMGKVEGASTITQQLAKNALLTHEKLFSRKIQEMYIAMQFERMYTKTEILEFYLNEVFLGHSAYGVESAARLYFNKSVEDLTLSESALIVGLLPAPNAYSPYRNLDLATRRRNIVLNKMVELDYITEGEANEARSEEINLERGREDNDNIAPYFVEHIRRQIIDMFGSKMVYTGGLKVHTTLDLDMQKKANQAIEEALDSYIPTVDRTAGEGKEQPQLAVVTTDPHTGHIKAMVGGRGDDKFNRVTQARRQPGSAFKPFVYATAAEKGWGTGSIIDDIPKEYRTTLVNEEEVGGDVDDEVDEDSATDEGVWIPRNYNDQYSGPTTLREALARSLNVPAVKLLDEVGINNTMNTARRMGIDNLTQDDRNLALALGGLTRGVTPLEMTTAYGSLATGGIKSQPIAITEVLDNNNNVIWSNESRRDIVLDESEAYLVTDMLQSAVSNRTERWGWGGTGWRANLGIPAAGKTGTTTNYTDAWFVGYTPDLVTTIWLGEDSPTRMEYENEDGGSTIVSSGTAARLWGDYMREVVRGRPVNDFERPNNIVRQEVSTRSGKLPNPYTPQNRISEELYIRGSEPTELDDYFKETASMEVDKETGMIATEYCPEEKITTIEYQVETGIIVDENKDPIRKLDDRKVPLTDDLGNFIYETIPDEECNVHPPEEDEEEEDVRDKILDFFNILRGR